MVFYTYSLYITKPLSSALFFAHYRVYVYSKRVAHFVCGTLEIKYWIRIIAKIAPISTVRFLKITICNKMHAILTVCWTIYQLQEVFKLNRLCSFRHSLDKLSFISGRLCYSDLHGFGDYELNGVSFILREIADDLEVVHDTLYK